MEWALVYTVVVITLIAIVLDKIKSKRRTRERMAWLKDVSTEAAPSTSMDDEVNDIYIAGLKHHCTDLDIGTFSGYVFNEKNNPADPEAMAIVDNKKRKIIGYVPAKILDDYRDWCSGKKRYCVGYIYWDGEYLRGRCRVYPSLDEVPEIEEDAVEYITQVANHFHWDLNEDGTVK